MQGLHAGSIFKSQPSLPAVIQAQGRMTGWYFNQYKNMYVATP